MNSLAKGILLVCCAAILGAPSSALAKHGNDRDDDRIDQRDDRDNSGPGSGSDRDDRDNSGPGSGDDRDYADRDDSSWGNDRDDSNSGSDRDDNSGSGSSGDHDDRDHDNSGSGSDRDDNSGSGSGSSDNSGSGSDRDDNSGSGSGSSDNSGPGSSGGGDRDDGRENSGDRRRFGEASANSAEATLRTSATVSRDDMGREYVSDEAILLGTRGDIDRAVEHGFALISERTLVADGRMLARMQTPSSTSVDDAVAQLASLAPDAMVTRNTVFRGAQVERAPAPAGARVATPPPRPGGGVVGVIDTGADVANLSGSVSARRAFASTAYTPAEHGTAVATIAVNHGARVQLADVFSNAFDGAPAASLEAIVAAIDWMMESDVPVINISVEGPDNAILAQIVRRAAERGFIVVAAAGNGGPMADPAFPGAFEGAVAVTAVDANNRAYVRANRGDYIDFAAPGVRVSVNLQSEPMVVTGTSFAAPLVSARLAAEHRRPSINSANAAVEALREQAIDLGAPGRDPIYGWGLIRPRED